MVGSIFSNSWYKVAQIRPRLRSHVQIHKHEYRNREWYVMQDHSTGKFHRFSPEAYYIIGLMDGKKTLDNIWTFACEQLEDDMPTQDEVIGLVSKLYRADVLQTNILPDAADLFQRFKQDRQNRLFNILRTPTSIKFPLFDPDTFLTHTVWLLRPIFSRWGALFWCLVLAIALVLTVLNWEALTADIIDRVLAMESLVLVWCLYPILKLIHEFAHGYAVKRWGGEVHEMGVMFLVFVPIPYVDASSATAFENKWQRMLVGGIGIMAELFVAALALFVWLNVPYGDVHAIAYNVMIIAGVSTLFFNGNPLLRFDAYYVLADFLEIPNLATRGNLYIGYLFRKYLLGIKTAVTPADSEGEAPLLGIYAILAFFYRIFITVRIILWVAGSFMVVGVLLAVWSGFAMVAFPLVRMIRLVGQDPELVQKQKRITVIVVAAVAVLFLFVGFVPIPRYTVSQGVAWPPEGAKVYAKTDGYVRTVAVYSGHLVKKEDILLLCENEELRVDVALLRSRLDELKARHMQAGSRDKTEADIISDEISQVEAELMQAAEKVSELIIKSPENGHLVLPADQDLPGRFVRRGEPLGFVLDAEKMTIRLVVPQTDIRQVTGETKTVTLRTASHPDQDLKAKIVRVVPAASRDLPSLALSLEGGGAYALDPREMRSAKVIEKLFQIELAPLGDIGGRIGERVYVRFQHPPEPFVYRWYRSARRLLLKRFDI